MTYIDSCTDCGSNNDLIVTQDRGFMMNLT
jgi:hypothetical protein